MSRGPAAGGALSTTLPNAQSVLERLLAPVPRDAFGASIRFATIESKLSPPRGYEDSWVHLGPGCELDGPPWDDPEETAGTSGIVLFVALPTDDQARAFFDVDLLLRDHIMESPPVVVVPLLSGVGTEFRRLRRWLAHLAEHAVIDAIVPGTPQGYALAFAVRAQFQSVYASLDNLQDEMHYRACGIDKEIRLLSSIQDMRWEYLRARVFPTIPRPQWLGIEEEDQIDIYTLGHEIARRSTGVFRAVRQVHGVDVQDSPALGILMVDKRRDVRCLGAMSLINDFLKIMDHLDRVPHPNISRLVNTFCGAFNLCFCMELAGTRTLLSRLRWRDFPMNGAVPLHLTPAGLQSLMVQVTLAVCHLHMAANICHRALAPDTISLRERGDGLIEAKVFGFEFAQPQFAGQRCTAAPSGPFPYLSPEAALSGEAGYDGKAADMWALGVTFLDVSRGLHVLQRTFMAVGCGHIADTSGAVSCGQLAITVHEVLRRPSFFSDILAETVPEAKQWRHWLEAVVPGLLSVDARERITAAELQPTVVLAPSA